MIVRILRARSEVKNRVATADQMNEKKMNDQNTLPHGYVFKVLNGALNGIEFALSARSYFICTDEDGPGAGNLAFADNTLQIPTPLPGNNFILDLAPGGPDNSIVAKICLADRQESRLLSVNQICHLSGLTFAIRRSDEPWSTEVEHGLLVSEFDKPVPPWDIHGPGRSTAHQSTPTRKLRHTLVILLVLGLLAVGAWSHLGPEPLRPAEQIHQIVGDRPGYSIHRGNDGNRYLFAATVQQAEWVNQALLRKKSGNTWAIVTPQSEETRLTYILESNNVAFFAIRFSEPEHPTLLLSRTRNQVNPEHLEKIRKLVLDAIPYAESVNIVLYEDSEVLYKAQQGLRALGFEYQIVRSESGVTLSSWMPSVDVHLTEFSRYVTQFYQVWGRRYVHFSADISDDALKDKSYKYGEDGYISMSRSHWLFNKRFQ